ncbi:MAG: hypothetical protein RSE12_04875 [Fuscovulum sp.]|nr:MAG: hypothetical protein RSE12_04875 [Fuscovulum sp.]
MEKVGPIPPPQALIAAGKVIPLGHGWVLEPMETGFLLKALSVGASVRVTPEEAQSVRQGEVPPEMLAARHGMVLPQMPPGAAVMVAFSDEAMRLAGKGREAGSETGGRSGDRPAGAGQAGPTLPRMAMIGAAVVALLIVALIWAG